MKIGFEKFGDREFDIEDMALIKVCDGVLYFDCEFRNVKYFDITTGSELGKNYKQRRIITIMPEQGEGYLMITFEPENDNEKEIIERGIILTLTSKYQFGAVFMKADKIKTSNAILHKQSITV